MSALALIVLDAPIPFHHSNVLLPGDTILDGIFSRAASLGE
jgi:hypothetical protein